MTLADAQAILVANEAAASDSFLFWLHERDRFDRRSFWQLVNAGIIAGSGPAEIRAKLRDPAFHIYDGILRLLLWHHAPHDQCRIRHVPGRDLNGYVDCLAGALVPLIRGLPAARRDATVPLRNPQRSVLKRYFDGEA